MADEYSQPPHFRTMLIPAQYNWQTLLNKSGDELEVHYNNLLRQLEKSGAYSGRYSPKVRTR